MLFADVRHYHADLDIWDLCNSGQHATWFAARSTIRPRTCAHVHLYPEVFYFPAGGASCTMSPLPGDFTFARLTRLDGRYRMHVLARRASSSSTTTRTSGSMRASTYEWPHAFARFDATPTSSSAASARTTSTPSLATASPSCASVCRLLDIDFDGFGALA